MERRQTLTLAGTTAVGFLAGCTGILTGAEISETVHEDDVFNIDLEEGDTVRIELENDNGFFAGTTFERSGGTEDGPLVEFQVETDGEESVTVPETDTYRLFVYTDGRASVELYVND